MSRRANESIPELIRLLLLSIAICLAFQMFLILTHEYAHSTTAWLLGYTPSPFTVVWGNLLTMRGWDEGVPYDRLFSSAGHPAEALIGGIPLLMHAVFVATGLYFLRRPALARPRLAFYALYWFVVANLAELIAYIWMRPFIPTGDTGRFNEGLKLSPWVLFVAGTVFIVFALAVILRQGMPKLDLFLGGSRVKHRIVLWLTAFFMFLWGSGLRILSLYPDRQWRWGLIGVVAFFGWVLADHLRSSNPVIESAPAS